MEEYTEKGLDEYQCKGMKGSKEENKKKKIGGEERRNRKGEMRRNSRWKSWKSRRTEMDRRK